MVRAQALSLFALLGLASCTTPKARTPEAIPEASDTTSKLQPNRMLPPLAYTDGVGIVVEVLPLKIPAGSGPLALIRVSGVKNRYSGVTFLAERNSNGEGQSWVVPLDGAPKAILRGGRNGMKGAARAPVDLALPQIRAYIRLVYDEDASKLVQSEELIADYEAHLADGSLQTLSQFDRVHAKERTRKGLEREREEFAERCGKEVAVHMDWDVLQSREDFEDSAFCAKALQNISTLCTERQAEKQEIAAKLDSIHCKRAAETFMDWDESKRSWTVHSNVEKLPNSQLLKTAISQSLKLHRIVLKSSGGLYLIVPSLHAADRGYYAGFGRKLYRQWGTNKNSRRDFTLWNGEREVSATMKKGGKWQVRCPQGTMEMFELDAGERDRVLTSSTLEEPIWQRMSFLLARDDRGIYYYVDRKRPELGGLDYRVYKGPRGRLVLTTMVDIVNDDEGQIFSTTSGSLRLAKGKEGARWLAGKKQTPLVVVSPQERRRLVFGDLGVYGEQTRGTLCSMAEKGNPGR